MESPLRQNISSVAEKIQDIVDAAERAATEIKAEAEADAARYRTERQREADALGADRAARLEELSVSLSEHADRIRADVISLSTELGRAADELRGHRFEANPARPQASPASDDVAGASSPRGATGLTFQDGTFEPVAYPGTGEGNGTDTAVPEEALLRATQMSVAGHSREEIETALRDEFEIADPAAITHHILGNANSR
jgi:hypothetical protein